MRARSFVIAAIVAIGILAAVLFVASKILISRFDAIEAQQAEGRAMHALRALETDLDQLAVSARDYGEGDKAYRAITSGDPEFTRAHFSYEALAEMQVDELVLLAPAGAPLYTAQRAESGHHSIVQASDDVVAFAGALRGRIDTVRERRSYERIFVTRRGLMAFTAIDIVRSDRTAPTGVVLFLGRYLQNDAVQRIRSISQLPVELSASKASLRGVQAVATEHTITAYMPLVNWRGQNVATLSVSGKRDIGLLGRHTTLPLMMVIAVLALLCVAVFLVTLDRMHRHWAERLSTHAMYRRMLAALDQGILLVEPQSGRIVENNEAMHRMLGYEAGELATMTVADCFIGLPNLTQLLRSPSSADSHDCRLRTRTGATIEAEIRVTEIADDAGRKLTCLVARDVSRHREAEQSAREDKARLAHLAEHDSLTGLPNRLHLQTRLPAVLERLAMEERSLALLYIDLDHFKHVNDSRGHGFGDEVLKIFAARLRHGIAAEDIVLRTGGDEFIVAATLRGDTPDVRDLGQRLLHLSSMPISHDGVTLTLTSSIGISIYPQDGLDCESLLKHADIALYRAKERGRNCFQLFTSDMSAEVCERVVLEQALRRALDTQEIYIELQPVFDLQTGELVSFESLARWQHLEMGLIPPNRFIPVAEHSGLIVGLGELVVREALLQLRQWQQEGLEVVPIAVNVSPVQFERSDFTTYVHEVALEYDVDPGLLVFEVTESAWLRDSHKHIVAIDTLRHAGSRVYIDDFGTGFSNLNYWKTLPIDAIKIDRSFVSHVDTDSNDAMIVGSIAAMARQLRLDTVAEGIETEAQAQRLRELGCTFAQGYLFGRPAKPEKYRDLLRRREPADDEPTDVLHAVNG